MHTRFGASTDLACTCDLEVATAAHDLRNRLGIALCELRQLRLQMGGPGVSDQLDSVERVLAQTTTQLEGLLEQACSQTSLRASVDARTVDLVEVVRSIVAQHGRIELDARVPRLLGTWDRHHVQHLVTSLLANALQYSLSDRAVVIKLDRAGEDALISVTDRGIGIPAAELPRIFEPFFRARNAEAIAPGLGLGLTTARLLVERYCGSLNAASVEGAGTTLRVRLPLVVTEVTPSICCEDPVPWPMPRPGHDCADRDDPAHALDARAPWLG
jgi:signal transduction histidine kinase